MVEVIGVRFKEAGKVYYFDPSEDKFQTGEYVIVETARGIECGQVAVANKLIDDGEIVKPLKKVLRHASEDDINAMHENLKKCEEALKICQEKIEKHNLEMKLVDVEYTFDGSKILFYFTADGRVDFRELVRDLAGVFRTRIELRQIGVRDEAKLLGGLGVCGKEFCCSQFMPDFHPVSIKMAKDQGLSLNSSKISGTCGRLMCCLKHEQDVYEELLKITPRVGSQVKVGHDTGVVCEASVLKGKVKVKLDREIEGAVPKTYDVKDVKVLRAAKVEENDDISELEE